MIVFYLRISGILKVLGFNLCFYGLGLLPDANDKGVMLSKVKLLYKTSVNQPAQVQVFLPKLISRSNYPSSNPTL